MSTPVTIYPKWKRLWLVAGLCLFIAAVLLAMIVVFPNMLPEANAGNAKNSSFLPPLYLLMGFMAMLGLPMALVFYHFSKISIRIHEDEVCLLWSGHECCQKLDQVIWNERSMIVGYKAVHGLKAQALNGFEVYKNTEIESQLRPRLKPENKTSSLRMILPLLKLKDPATLFSFYAITSMLLVGIWIESLKTTT